MVPVQFWTKYLGLNLKWNIFPPTALYQTDQYIHVFPPTVLYQTDQYIHVFPPILLYQTDQYIHLGPNGTKMQHPKYKVFDTYF